ncbi:hypothetical protein EON65_27290 [archaeon]|nr:MAG: hypothetical protein EON65_27290 [archaeon]
MSEEQYRQPSVRVCSDFKDDECQKLILPLLEKHQVLADTKGLSKKKKWVLVSEDLAKSLDPKVWRTPAAETLRMNFLQFRKNVIDKSYTKFLMTDIAFPIDEDDIANSFHLKIVNMIREASYKGNSESSKEESDVAPCVEEFGIKRKTAKVRFEKVEDESSSDDDIYEEDDCFFSDSTSSHHARPVKTDPKTQKLYLNTQHNAHAFRRADASPSKRAKIMQSGMNEEVSTISVLHLELKLQEVRHTSTELAIRLQELKNRGFELELQVQEAKTKGVQLELELRNFRPGEKN